MKNKLEIMEKLYPINKIIEGEVYMHTPFGVFLKIGHSNFLGLIEIVNFLDEGIMNYSLYPPLKSIVRACVLGHRPENDQVYLSMKPSVLEQAKLLKV